LNRTAVERSLGRLGLRAPALYVEETASTNSVALTMAEQGAPEWTLVVAGHQSAGRGRLGRSWASTPGKSLLFSLVLRPPMRPERAPLLSFLAAVAMLDAFPPLQGEEAGSKWPNDLMIGRRKVGGILPEARVAAGGVEHLVLGIGVNVTMREGDFPDELRDRATSLAVEGGAITPEALLVGFLDRFRRRYAPKDPRVGEGILARYRERCITLGRRVRVSALDGGEIDGTATAISPDGGLVVISGGREQLIAFGEVEHLR
jgi:BirA family biotin operon repressor/biotin-[acetyl-CoA-carboxylase] ligase